MFFTFFRNSIVFVKDVSVDITTIENGILEETDDFFILSPIASKKLDDPKRSKLIVNDTYKDVVCWGCEKMIISIFVGFCDKCTFNPEVNNHRFNKEAFKQTLLKNNFTYLSPEFFFDFKKKSMKA